MIKTQVIKETNNLANFWSGDWFPVVYKNGKPQAVLVDMISFTKMQLIIDNLLHREAEPEDALLVARNLLNQWLEQAKKEAPSLDWQKELDEL